MDKTVFRPHTLRKVDYAGSVHIDQGDKTILRVYKGVLETTMTATLHFFLGLGSRCFEEQHDQQIEDLEERVRIQAEIIVAYIKKYGQLRAK